MTDVPRTEPTKPENAVSEESPRPAARTIGRAPGQPFSKWRTTVQVRCLVWLVFVFSWTMALLTTRPVQIEEQLLPVWALYPAAKSLHIASYAVLTVLTGWLGLPARYRWLLLVFLSAHAGATECFQRFVPLRHSSWRDVGFDHLGIVLGLVLSWHWWRPLGREPEATNQAATSE